MTNVIPLFKHQHPTVIRALERMSVVALPAITHRYMPAWVTADPVYSVSVPHLERHGWDIRPLHPGVFQCTHPRLNETVDYVTALEITLMFLIERRMKGMRNV